MNDWTTPGKWILVLEPMLQGPEAEFATTAFPDWGYCDPQEVVYRLVKIDDNGKLLVRDLAIIGGEHGKFGRLREALSYPYSFRPIRTPAGDIRFVEDRP